ncbi:MAG: hypothetical protein ACLF0G_00765 [Candidatus Brocadiia bacterium]
MAPCPGAGLERLMVLRSGYPRAFFFRAAEATAANPRWSYERWEATFGRLMGIEGKVLDEEVPGRSRRNIEFFARFKRAHPRQLVLLHYNGNARDPRYQTEKYFAGHWLYYNGATILADVPAEEGVAELRVDEPGLFRTGVGRYRESNEDVGLCMLDAEGRPDWRRAEQVQLLSVDRGRGTLRVRRGCYGTEPRAFPAGRAYAAAHAHEGPWGRRSHLMWFYNYSTRCPRDEAGRTCGEVHAEELAARFLPGGELTAFDGVEFDVLHHAVGRRRGPRGPDCDADGEADSGVFDGVNSYGVGVVDFCRALRRKLGEGRLLLADGHGLNNQRAFGILNGIESEGWPTLRDWAMDDWSGGLNRHFFWAARGRSPAFSYVNHKFIAPGDEPGRPRRPDVPWNVHRLVFAAAVLTDSAICYSFAPPREEGGLFGLWDELWKGTERQVGWLGQPLGPPVRLAKRGPDLLAGAAPAVARDAGEGQRRFLLEGVPCRGPDLFVAVRARAEPLPGRPREVARLMWVGIPPPEAHLTREEPPRTGMCLRGGEERELDPDTGAAVRYLSARRLPGPVRAAYFVHPPYRGVAGYAFWEREATVPREARLDFFLGMGEKSPERSDGVTFRVLVGGREVFEHRQKASEWTHHTVSLARWAGQRVKLKFISDCGPDDDTTTDHSMWGDVWLLGPGGKEAVTPGCRSMAWVDDREFESGFYFPDVRSQTVDLEFVVEGAAPVTLASVRAYAAPDVMVREFQGGVVLANPSPRPYVFDLAALFGGARFRRLKGSPRQDPATNDGSRVRGPVELGPKDALFLVTEAP